MTYSFYCTWNLPGSSQFDYIYFSAISRKEAVAIASDWIDFKAEQYESETEIANGYCGELVSETKSKCWKYDSGNPILVREEGQESYCYWQNNK